MTAAAYKSQDNKNNLVPFFRWAEADDDMELVNNEIYASIQFGPSNWDRGDRTLMVYYASQDHDDDDHDDTNNHVVGLGRLVPLFIDNNNNNNNTIPSSVDCGNGTTETNKNKNNNNNKSIIIHHHHHWEMGGIYVAPEARGKGIARSIVNKLIEEATRMSLEMVATPTMERQQPQPQQSITKMTLWCIPFAHLREFYKSCGFIITVDIHNNTLLAAEKNRTSNEHDDDDSSLHATPPSSIGSILKCKLSGCASTFPDKPTILMKIDLL